MTRHDRERFGELFSRLMDVQPDRDDPSEADSALRLLGNSLLNYFGAVGPDAAGPLSETLPWLAAFLQWTDDGADPDAVAGRLADTAAVDTLSRHMITRRLSASSTHRADSPLGRTPRVADQPLRRQVEVVWQLARTDERLTDLVPLSDDELRGRLISDSSTLAAACELCEDAGDTSLVERLAATFPVWKHAAQRPVDVASSESLWILAGLEADDCTNPLAAGGFDFGARERGFERGLAQNMARMDLVAAVRAALAFDGGELVSSEARESLLRQFGRFRSDPALLQLGSALIDARRRCLDYVFGGAPLVSMRSWIEYLRGPCVELAEVRECTLREAVGYAHYCLHLVNVCDFAALGPRAFSQNTREELSRVEDELKEFALAGQREGLSDGEADLGRFERARWRRAGDACYLADRLSRLRGAWRMGVTPGPVGSPPTLDADTNAHSLALIENLVGESTDDDISGLARLLEQASFKNYRWVEHLDPPHILTLMATAATMARDRAGIDVSRPFDVDLGPLGRWASDAERGRLNRRILGALLDRRDMADVLNGCAEPAALRRGVVGQCDDPSPADSSGHAQPPLVMRFVADPELKALLELMGTTTAEEADFHDVLERRLGGLLSGHRPAEPDEASPANFEADPSADHAGRSTAGSSSTRPTLSDGR